ncbi:hypothetical protein BH23GEM9_BH23GEM9_12730 [soil metagenome]
MKGCTRVMVWCATALTLMPCMAQSQTAWDSPLLLPPRPADGIGIYLVDMSGGGIGLMGTWRSPVWNFGVRAGMSEGGAGDELAVFGGVDFMGPVTTATADLPVDVDWIVGAGMGINDGARISFPAGLTASHSVQTEGARFTPFITPRIVLDGFIGGERRERSRTVDLGFALDIGLDLRLTGIEGPFAGSTIRFAASVGDRSAIGIGLAF